MYYICLCENHVATFIAFFVTCNFFTAYAARTLYRAFQQTRIASFAAPLFVRRQKSRLERFYQQVAQLYRQLPVDLADNAAQPAFGELYGRS